MASGSRTGGSVSYCIQADDATNFQNRCGELYFSAVNKAGTITCTVSTVTSATEIVAVSAGTLTNTFTCVDDTNKVGIAANAVSSLTQTTLQIDYRVNVNGTATVTGL